MSVADRTGLRLTAAMLVVCCAAGAMAQTTAPGALLIDVETAEKLGMRIQWQTNLALGDRAIIENISIQDHAILVQESGNIVSLVQRADGKVRWRQSVGSVLDRFSEPVLNDNQVLLAGASRLYLLRADNGETEGAIELKHLASTSPVLEGGQIIFGSTSGRVFAHGSSHGLPTWDYQMASSISVTPVRVGGLLLATDITGTVAMLNPMTGNVIWRRARPPWNQVSAEPIVDGETVYVACEDQALYAFGRATGAIRWQYMTESPLTESPLVLDDRVLLPTRDQGLVCLNAADGSVRWRCDAAGVPLQHYDGKLLLQDGDRITTVELKTGEVVETVELPLAQIILSPAPEGPTDLILARYDGRILKLSPK